MTRAGVKLAIEESLDELPKTYGAEIFQKKYDSVYQYVYDLLFNLDNI